MVLDQGYRDDRDVQWASRVFSVGALTTTALALAESRVEEKRSLPWEQLLCR